MMPRLPSVLAVLLAGSLVSVTAGPTGKLLLLLSSTIEADLASYCHPEDQLP